MMMETVLSRSIRLICAGGMAVGIGMLAQPVFAQEAATQRVEVTGSSIKRLAAENALPITTIRADDFIKQGLTTAQEVLNTLPMNQSSQTSSQSVGASTGGKSQADLRGLGTGKTLVLLNGRRLATHPYDAASTDLNIIPVSALEKVEILRDGASAIYGTDAIGGVINFITKRSITGGQISVETSIPQKSGGGTEKRINISGGFGDLDADGYNIFAVADLHKQDALKSTDRDFSRTGVIPSRGLNKTSGTPFPANFFSANGITGNPSFATGCNPPSSAPKASNGTCRFDFTQFIDDIPKTEQDSFFGQASYKLNAANTLSAEYLHSRSTNVNRVAPPPLAGIGLTIHSTSPYYPGGTGGTPAVAGLTGEDLDLNFRPLETGQRQEKDISISDRLLFSMKGTIADWDYKTGLAYAVSNASSTFTGGYLKDQAVIDGVGSGLLNPFGPQTTAGSAYLQASLLKGRVLEAQTKSTTFDFTASRQLMELPGGPLGIAVGTEFRKDKAQYLVNRDIASQASSSGLSNTLDEFGERNVSAVYTEMLIPIIKDLEIQLALRYDRYSDFGSTVNPKIAFRYQPTKQVLFRGSYNTGFRAPTLYEVNAPNTVSNTSDAYSDPKLCPGGVANPGVNPNIACDQQQNLRGGGNKNVGPEKSKTYTVGMVFEPITSFTTSIDIWKIDLRDSIGSIAEQELFANFTKYQDRFVYSADGNTLLYVNAAIDNLGEVHTRGVDLSISYRLPKTSMGNFSFSGDGTYVDKYEYQNVKDGEFTQNAGVYADANPVARWRHTASVQWSTGPWNVSLSQKFQSGYLDQNKVAAAYKQYVGAYSTWALSSTYTGFNNLSLTAGVKNLFDKNPPFTNQGTTFQQGYDPRYTDPLGRSVYLRAGYKF